MAQADEKKFAQMSGGEKVVFIGKVIVFIVTFGFAFPTILHDQDYVRKFQ